MSGSSTLASLAWLFPWINYDKLKKVLLLRKPLMRHLCWCPPGATRIGVFHHTNFWQHFGIPSSQHFEVNSPSLFQYLEITTLVMSRTTWPGRWTAHVGIGFTFSRPLLQVYVQASCNGQGQAPPPASSWMISRYQFLVSSLFTGTKQNGIRACLFMYALRFLCQSVVHFHSSSCSFARQKWTVCHTFSRCKRPPCRKWNRREEDAIGDIVIHWRVLDTNLLYIFQSCGRHHDMKFGVTCFLHFCWYKV